MPTAPARPRLSAVLIVKDEEEVLGACLDALRGAVDEVVVYDTGSSDSTRDLARARGAVVVEGFWNDHFGDARNRALAHATGDWVLSVDADEVLTGDTTALRRRCASAPQGLVQVVVESSTGGGGSHRSHPVRLFRRGGFTWVGALHEYLVPVAGAPDVTASSSAVGCNLEHSGYEPAVMASRGKAERNLAVARSAVEALPTSGEEPTAVWDALGRSLAMAGRPAEALEALDTVLALQGNSSVVLASGRAALSCMRELADWRRADDWLEALTRHGERPGAVAAWRAHAALATGDLTAAAHQLDEAERSADVDGGDQVVSTTAVPVLRSELARRSGRADEALELLLDHLRVSPGSTPLAAVVDAAAAASTDLAAVVRRVPRGALARTTDEAVLLPQPDGDRWLRALVAEHLGDAAAVVAGTLVASRSDLETAVHWSSEARAAGLAHLCPLRTIGDDAGRPAADRVLAWSLVAGVAEDADARDRLAALLAGLTPEELVGAVGPSAELVPAVVDVLAAAVDAALAAQAHAAV